MNESDYIAIIGMVVFVVIVVGVSISYLRLPHHKNKILMSTLLYRLEEAERTVREIDSLCRRLLNVLPKVHDSELAVQSVISIQHLLKPPEDK